MSRTVEDLFSVLGADASGLDDDTRNKKTNGAMPMIFDPENKCITILTDDGTRINIHCTKINEKGV